MKEQSGMKQRFLVFLLAVAFTAGGSFAPAIAQDNAGDMMPPRTSPNTNTGVNATASPGSGGALAPGEATHPAIRLTPDKSEMIRLSRDANSIIVGNESHIQVLMDSPKRLILVPRQPGATFFTILDKDGGVIMQRHAIVGSPKEKYIRIRRSCANAQGECEETSVYYCPGMCHDVQIQTNTQSRQSRTNLMPSGSTGAPGTNNRAGNGGSGGNGNLPAGAEPPIPQPPQ